MFKTILPCGKLYTTTGQTYWLISSQPVGRDSWQQDNQQRWSVVPYEPIEGQDWNGGFVYNHARHIVTTNPTIEFMYFDYPIMVKQTEMGVEMPINLSPDEQLVFDWSEQTVLDWNELLEEENA